MNYIIFDIYEYICIVLIMKYYKLKTVAFYIFATTIISFDLKGSENENEGICSCCNCWNNKEKKEEKETEVENKDDGKDEEKKENKEAEKTEENKEKEKNKNKKEKKKQKEEEEKDPMELADETYGFDL